MHYYKFNIADYRKDTCHLTRVEHGIYRDLIDWYYLNEKPIPNDTEMVSRWLRLETEEKPILIRVLSDFFVLVENEWHHKRIDSEIELYSEKCSTNGQNAKLGGRPKKTQSDTNGNRTKPSRIHNQEPLTKNQEEKTLSGKPDDVKEIIDYLNEKTGSAYRDVDSTRRLVGSRLKEGATVEQAKAVIDAKCLEWLGDKKMACYLRPATLFAASNFENYLGALSKKPTFEVFDMQAWTRKLMA